MVALLFGTDERLTASVFLTADDDPVAGPVSGLVADFSGVRSMVTGLPETFDRDGLGDEPFAAVLAVFFVFFFIKCSPVVRYALRRANFVVVG